MIEELSARIWSYVAFHADIAALREHMLHRKYIASEPRPFSEEALIRLLKSATILAASKRLEFREAAYKIATAAAEIETPELTGARQLLLLVLSRIGNFPALAFAKRRFGVSEDALPIRALAETYERNSRNTVILSGQKVALTDFQFELWSQLEHNLTLGVSAPTSAGKSFVLQAYAKKLFSQRAAKNMVFVVPTRALINQVSDDVAGWLSAQDMDGELVTTPIPKSAELPVRGVYVVTQERLQLLQSAHPQLGFDLMLVDEAQSIGEGPRGVLLSSVIDEAITRNDQMQLLFAGPNLTDPGSFARVFGRDQKTVKTEEASVVQNIIFVDVDEIQTSKARLSLFAEGNKIEIGLLDFDQPMIDHKSKLVNVALGLGKDGQSLIYALGAWESEEIAFGLADTDEASSDDLKELSNFIKDAVHEKYLLAQSVLKRVGYHYGRMPALVRKAIEDAFSDGLLRYLVTTSTLLYGVNLPAQNLFLHNPERGKGQPISSNDFWNLAGRAGRLGKEFSGNIFLIDYGTWPSDPMAGPKEKEVIPSIEEHIVRRTDELIAYMNNPNIIPDREKPDELENTFVKLVRDHLEGRLSATLEKVGISSTSQKAAEIETAVSQSVTATDITKDTLLASPTVSIHRQQSLYERLDASLSRRGPAYIIPKHPRDPQAYNSYLAAIRRCHGAILKYSTSDNSDRYYAQIALRWMKGDPLPRIIDASLEYKIKQGQSPNIATVIRNTLTDIESGLRFKYVRLFSCYNAVLELLLRNKGMSELVPSIPAVPMYLEVGASSPTMISFMGLGLSRFTAGKLSGLARRANMSQGEARAWIKSQDVEALAVPAATIREIGRMIVG